MPAGGLTDETPDAFEGGGIPWADTPVELGSGGRDEMGMSVDGSAVLPARGFTGFVTVAFEIEREVQGRHTHGLGMGRGVFEEAFEIVSPYVEDDLAGAGLLALLGDEEAFHVRAMQAHLEEVGDLRVGRTYQSPLIVGFTDHFFGDDLPERIDVHFFVGLCWSGEALRKRANEALFGRGVHDGEGDFLEGPGEVDGEGSMEKLRDLMAVIAEGSATPGAKNQGIVAMGLGYGEDLRDTLAQDRRELVDLRGAGVLGQRSGGGDEGGVVRGGKQVVLVIPEHRDVRRVDHGVAVEAASLGPMVAVHGPVLEGEVEGAGTT